MSSVASSNKTPRGVKPAFVPSGTDAQSTPIRNKQPSVERVTDRLETPSLDDRSYRVIRLSNQLEALLVHDAETDKASAALDVNVGSFGDEDDMPGMAQAVEHLLFMGTKKYPTENAYNQYLSAHSGYSNAYTGGTSTNYFFELNAKPTDDAQISDNNNSPLYGALDRFAQFFIEPLCLSSTLDRELNAVDSENKKNLQSDQWRLNQLSKSLSNPKDPYCHFSTGNYEVPKTFPESRGIDVQANFIEFHKKHYSANRMTLCVLGREPLDLLEQWIVEFFSAVPDKRLPSNRWEPEKLYSKEFLGIQSFDKPAMDYREPSFFPFLDKEFLYESQPSRRYMHNSRIPEDLYLNSLGQEDDSDDPEMTRVTQRRHRRGRGARKNNAYWKQINSEVNTNPFDGRELLFDDGNGSLKAPRMANLDTQLKISKHKGDDLVMSSHCAKELGLLGRISSDFEDPCLRSISGHSTAVKGILRNVQFRLKGGSVTFRRDFWVSDSINDIVDVMIGANFIKDHFKLLFERVKECVSTFATWFSKKRETPEQKAEREERERQQQIQILENETKRLREESEMYKQSGRANDGSQQGGSQRAPLAGRS
ncbi:hypothetical protein PFICI_10843 [Pestalotiopsis fici W106-1]|uniref:Peptidase M16 N-terminal domain-containing protein n=1 Tax=Pestalotiopsis fici (strain W106-1 / CGMCC3.15140) TaxID=1229662 RepID=W3WT22_PESFW|nr:uncharacterized protein PFICI_10843 [Pestalotiopsis fici W106-1]ETS76969.1 hypothetical protein PFICI_10843 [Pestalotiopsis fici W106-1]